MKTFWSLLAKILLVIVIVEAWFLYDYYHKNQQLIAENVQLEIELLQSKEGYRVAYAQYNKLEQLKYLIHEEVAIKLGVVIGFNATDGD